MGNMRNRAVKAAGIVSIACILAGGCAVRTQFQGCVVRCPDAIKDPAQIEAEGERDATVAEATERAPFNRRLPSE